MSKVYITNANLNLISKSLKRRLKISRTYMISDISDDFDKEFLTYNHLNDILNTDELQDIYTKKNILRDFSKLLDSIQQNKTIVTNYIKTENQKYAFTIKQPSYHRVQSCEWMKKNFNNIEIPHECISNKEKSDQVKKWIKNNEENLKNNFNYYNNLFKYEFNCIEGLKQINLKNSGYEDVDNKTFEMDINTKIKEKYRQLRFFFDTEFADKIMNFRYAPNYKINDILENEQNQNLKKNIIDFHTIKNELKNIIIQYYKDKYNTDLSFEKIF